MKSKTETLLELIKRINQMKEAKSNDFTEPDENADKTGSDEDSDYTVKKRKTSKSKLEVNPDSTGIDTKADKTKKES